MAEKRFSKEEIRQIINKATKMQHKDLNSDLKEREGLRLEELEQIGEEMGLSAKYLRAAAAQQSEQPVQSYSGSNDTHIYEERELTIELDADAWGEITSELRHYFGTNYGTIEESHKNLEWTHMSLAGVETKVNLTNRGEHARLRMSQRVGLGGPITEALMYGGSTTVVLVALWYAFFQPGAISLIAGSIGLLAGCSALVYKLDTLWRKKKQKNLSELSDKIANQLFRSKKTDRKKKLKFETDVSEKHKKPSLENILWKEPEEQNQEGNKAKGRDQTKT